MATLITRPRRPVLHRSPADANALYGFGYRPDWPSILSVAHDEADGGKLFVITDRPCVVFGPQLPLAVDGGYAVSDAVAILPVKFQLTMTGAVAAGATWRWIGGLPSQLQDARTGHVPNAGAGTVDDFAGPYTPPPLASVIDAQAAGADCTLTFDQPVLLTFPQLPTDDALRFDGVAPINVQQVAINGLQFYLSNSVGPGSTWEIARQPSWISSPVANPASGTF